MKPLNENYQARDLEESVLKHWQENQVFEKSIESRPKENSYTFYDGPPFITGLPHYGHLLGSIVKDVIPRYQTMKGKRVPRVWGWDCHGLPAENKVEKELGINSKKEIETLGIDKFVAACKAYVNNVSADWEWYVEHIGRWVDFKNAYKTMDMPYMESVLWVFKELYEKKLIYKGKRVSLFCPRCSTPISNFEVAMDNSYKDVSDPSVYVLFKLKDREEYFAVWTTTPWTLPSNFALAVDPKLTYVKVSVDGRVLILAKKLAKKVLGKDIKIEKEMSGKDLVGTAYEPLYSYFQPTPQDYHVYSGDFVSDDEGTGVVHIAPGFGEDDTNLGKTHKLSIVDSVDDEGHLDPKITVAAGKYFKAADKLIIADLEIRGLMLKKEMITHSYPHCWRCSTPLIYKAQVAWYIDIQSLKDQLLIQNENINWVPKHFKEGRFKQGIENAPDWCISRTRYWGAPIPVWECECGERFVAGSVSQIEKASGQKITDLHRPEIDQVVIKCQKCGGQAHRVKEVLDSWVEAASMPYAERHYPFENEAEFKANFPADFIVEYTGQLRAWFYVMHVISNALYQTHCFKNVIVTGVIMGTDGRKMSKNYGNYPDPKDSMQKYGADSLRLYLLGSPIVMGEDIAISEADWQIELRSTINILWNSYKFFANYAAVDGFSYSGETPKSTNPLDLWILNRLTQTITGIEKSLDSYVAPKAVEQIKLFVSDLSTWYIRRSRDRVGPTALDKEDRKQAYQTLGYVFDNFFKAIAPVVPFISEYLFRHLTDKLSVHLEDWPKVSKKIDQELLDQMVIVRKICEAGNASRKNQNLAVKQPLAKITVTSKETISLSEGLVMIIKEELNVDAVEFTVSKDEVLAVTLDTKITPELLERKEGREIIRAIQGARKTAGCRLDEVIKIKLPAWPKSQEETIKSQALVSEILKGETLEVLKE